MPMQTGSASADAHPEPDPGASPEAEASSTGSERVIKKYPATKPFTNIIVTFANKPKCHSFCDKSTKRLSCGSSKLDVDW
ncbi:hypothetical protein P3G55_24080, partial [Leptospira sp. 96542]|nr:hypothetical protein [Leptospira sp. 96542]